MAQYRLNSATVEAQQWRKLGDLKGDAPFVKGSPRIVEAYHRDDVPGTAACVLCKHPMSSHGWIKDRPEDKSMMGVPVEPVTGKPSAAAQPTKEQRRGFQPADFMPPDENPKMADIPASWQDSKDQASYDEPSSPLYPKKYKKGELTIDVKNSGEEQEAKGDGFVLVPDDKPVLPSSDQAPVPPAGDRVAPDPSVTSDAPHPGPAGPAIPSGNNLSNQVAGVLNTKPDDEETPGIPVCPGDWVIQAGNRISTCKPDLFIHLYSKV